MIFSSSIRGLEGIRDSNLVGNLDIDISDGNRKELSTRAPLGVGRKIHCHRQADMTFQSGGFCSDRARLTEFCLSTERARLAKGCFWDKFYIRNSFDRNLISLKILLKN